jgi:hypothetical protein
VDRANASQLILILWFEAERGQQNRSRQSPPAPSTMGVLTSPSPLQGLAFGAPNALTSAPFRRRSFPLFLVPLSMLLPLASLNRSRQTEPAQQFSPLPLAARGGN